MVICPREGHICSKNINTLGIWYILHWMKFQIKYFFKYNLTFYQFNTLRKLQTKLWMSLLTLATAVCIVQNSLFWSSLSLSWPTHAYNHTAFYVVVVLYCVAFKHWLRISSLFILAFSDLKIIVFIKYFQCKNIKK